MNVVSLLACLSAVLAVDLVSFDGTPSTTFKFVELNDPVMGGRSVGTWTLNGTYGIFDGEVKDVPSLKAPGFIKVAADGTFSDSSSALNGGLVLMVRSSTPEYKGFRVTVVSGTMSPSYSCAGGGSLPFSRGCFKSKFTVPESNGKFIPVHVPFSSFSDKWSPATGEQTSTCAKDKDVCLTAKALSAIKRIELWAEGADGKIHLEVQSISASPQATFRLSRTPSIRPPAANDTCKSAVQANLRFGISGRTAPDVPVAVDSTETLAEAVCCDARVKVFAEPQFLYQAPDIALYSKMDKGITTFYDSVCGLPLFQAPQGRTLEEFKADTDEHGWPSFRKEEVVTANVVTDKETGFVTSACGTHLGSFLPDDKGPRWCMDLSCISGRPADQAF